jgi:DNA processing protein
LWPLDREDPGRYLQRLTMLGFGRHNQSATAPTNRLMPWSLPAPIAWISGADLAFPAALRRSPRPPADLWFAGRLPDSHQPAVAMVGSRAASRAACRLAGDLAGSLVRSGYAVISGGALGIDAAAHRGALVAGGATFAVLGCGVDVLYPDRHGPLFAEIVASGGLLSEYPPGTPPRSGQFPVRNRIVAGLAQATLVVEARPASGALITARLAREAGRDVLAVPGSPGTDLLIASGAARAVEDSVGLLARLAGAEVPERAVPPPLAALVEALRAGVSAPPDIAAHLGVSLPEALGRLAEAELVGWVHRLPGGRFEVPRAS